MSGYAESLQRTREPGYRFTTTHDVNITVHDYRARARRLQTADGQKRAVAVCRIEFTRLYSGERFVRWVGCADEHEMEYIRPYRLIDRAIADAVALALGTDPGEDE
jgi:hypothetical protein